MSGSSKKQTPSSKADEKKFFRWVRLGELLVSSGLVSQEDFELALEAQKSSGRQIGDVLIQLGFVSRRQLLEALANQMDVAAWEFSHWQPDAILIASVDGESCRRLQAMPVGWNEDHVVVAMRNPTDVNAIDFFAEKLEAKIEPALADEATLAEAIERVYFQGTDLQQVHVDALVSEALGDGQSNRSKERSLHLHKIEQQTRPVISLVNKVISDALKSGASDIHLEPQEGYLHVRYRVDGRLRTVSTIPAKLTKTVVARIKIMAELDPVEWRTPQDGRFSVKVEDFNVDMRVSVFPSLHGGRVVMRILDRANSLLDLDELGLSEHNYPLFMDAINQPYGLFLVTGPTGCGKTTTLYSAMQSVRSTEINVLTCEDPVEYTLEGISQSHTNPKIGLTFAEQLRAILRQDPDVILVGEIRDAETAETAARAANTGHMVFSTLHCKTAPSAIVRLQDMGVDRWMLGSAVTSVMSQRLVRKLCPTCRVQQKATAAQADVLEGALNTACPSKLWVADGCHDCGETGYAGRVAVHEILPVNEEIGELISHGAPQSQLEDAGRKAGYRTMQEDAAERILRGETSCEEARRLLVFGDRRNPKAA
jgi:type IV pilus assembly protein PilB